MRKRSSVSLSKAQNLIRYILEFSMNLLDEIPYLTVRIEAVSSNGEVSYGTGFHYGFLHPTKGEFPCIGTNKHVLKGASKIFLHVNRAKSKKEPEIGSHIRWEIDNIENQWVGHPDKDCDLAVFPFGEIINVMLSQGIEPFFRQFGPRDVPDQATLTGLRSVEDVMMIGYPTGLWDSKNNFPIIRRGITATPLKVDHNGNKEFLIDSACFPGSSGSPIVLANSGFFVNSNGDPAHGERFLFLGVLWGGPQYTTEGNIVAKPVPTNHVPVALSSIPMNLGYCVKSARILEMDDAVWSKWGGR